MNCGNVRAEFQPGALIAAACILWLFNQSPQLLPYFKNAYGYAVFSTVGKGGLR